MQRKERQEWVKKKMLNKWIDARGRGVMGRQGTGLTKVDCKDEREVACMWGNLMQIL